VGTFAVGDRFRAAQANHRCGYCDLTIAGSLLWPTEHALSTVAPDQCQAAKRRQNGKRLVGHLSRHIGGLATTMWSSLRFSGAATDLTDGALIVAERTSA